VKIYEFVLIFTSRNWRNSAEESTATTCLQKEEYKYSFRYEPREMSNISVRAAVIKGIVMRRPESRETSVLPSQNLLTSIYSPSIYGDS
jgi:hypothetical protein